MQITLIGFKDVPIKSEPKYKPVYGSVHFVDGSQYKTQEVPQNQNCKFNHKHVILLGNQDPSQIKELLATKTIRVYIHDNDIFNSNLNFSKGLGQFSFRDFLRPNCKELKLRSEIFPTKTASDDNHNELNLNTTARKTDI